MKKIQNSKYAEDGGGPLYLSSDLIGTRDPTIWVPSPITDFFKPLNPSCINDGRGANPPLAADLFSKFLTDDLEDPFKLLLLSSEA